MVMKHRIVSIIQPKDAGHVFRMTERYLPLVQQVGALSKDRSTKIGAVAFTYEGIILATGRNGFPIGVDDSVDERHERPTKYDWTVHAEKNLVAFAARRGTALLGSIVIAHGLPICSICAGCLINAGISHAVYAVHESTLENMQDIWKASMPIVRTMFNESGVVLQETVYS